MSPVPELSRRGLFGLGAAAGAVLLAGCGSDSSPATAPSSAPSASGGGSPAALEPYTVRTCVYAKNHASAPLYWQQFAPAGITVNVVPVKSATEVAEALEGDQLDFGLMGPYNTVIAAAEGRLTSRIVGMTARQGIGLIGKKGSVATVADLKGKKVGVPPPGIQLLIINDLLGQAGLTLGTDVESIPVSYADQPAALEQGSVDAYVGTEPLCTQSVVNGVGVRLAEIGNSPVGDFNTANWASAKILQQRPDVVQAVALMQKQAAEFLTPGGVNDKQRWKELLVTQFGYSEPVYEAVLENVGAVWKFDQSRVDQVKGSGMLLKQQGGISTEPDYEALFARDYWDV